MIKAIVPLEILEMKQSWESSNCCNDWKWHVPRTLHVSLSKVSPITHWYRSFPLRREQRFPLREINYPLSGSLKSMDEEGETASKRFPLNSRSQVGIKVGSFDPIERNEYPSRNGISLLTNMLFLSFSLSSFLENRFRILARSILQFRSIAENGKVLSI